MDTSTKQLLYLLHIGLRGHCRRQSRKIMRARRPESCCESDCVFSIVRSYSHKDSPPGQPTGVLNKGDFNRYARVVGESHRASTLHKELQAAKRCREREKQSSSGESTPTGYPPFAGQLRKQSFKWQTD